MAYPGNFFRLVVSGKGDGDERWSWGLAIQSFDGSNDEPNLAAVPAGVLTAVRDFHSATSNSRAKLDSVKLNEVGTNGRYVNPQTVETIYQGGQVLPGTLASQGLPAQVALAVTLRTDVDRGLASRGRFFIPYPAYKCEADGFLSAANVATISDAARTMLNAVGAAMPGQVVVASDVRTGAFRRVLSVDVGNRYDIIRSRGKSLRETYTSAVLAADPN